MIRAGACLAAAIALTGSAVRAENYPSRPIALITPFAAGGSNDIIARSLGKKLSDTWGQPVIVENRPGAGGVIGASAVAAAAPDGYTLLVHSNSHTVTQATYKNLNYSPSRDFTGVMPLAFFAGSVFGWP